jgi:leucyl-tRNA synthetase
MTEATPEQATYDIHAVEEKWLPVWERLDQFRADDEAVLSGRKEKKYALTMFPYPSGDLHMGHAEVTALHDVIARYWWQQGFEVLNPMGWDSFGLPAENAAIKNDEHPATYTYGNIETQYESFRRYACSFDWSRRFNTSDPEYYRWTQWLFLKLREQGLAYRKNSPVNWCPSDQTVLANEQVLADGTCERCGAMVTKRDLTQWYFKTTKYAEEYLRYLDELQDTWIGKVVNAQRNWIGRSEGAHVDFAIEGQDPVRVYTTRPDTIFGTTFMVIAVDSPLAESLVSDARREAFEAYREETRKASDIDRLSTERPKTGVDLGVQAINPVTGQPMPVWATDYVLADYGTGAVMGVPGGDQRDWEFATQMGCRSFVRPRSPRTSTVRRTRARARRSTRRLLGSRATWTSTACRWPTPSAPPSTSWRPPAQARARSTTGCATGCCRDSVIGALRSRSSTVLSTARSRSQTTNCRCCCPSCGARI